MSIQVILQYFDAGFGEQDIINDYETKVELGNDYNLGDMEFQGSDFPM